MTMADKERPNLTRKSSKARLKSADSKLSVDTKIRTPHHAETEEHHQDKNRAGTKIKQAAAHEHEINEAQKYKENEKNANSDKIKEKNSKKGRKGKKKGKGKTDKKEESKEIEREKSFDFQVRGTITTRERLRNYVFDKVKAALSVVCTDGVTHVDVDNVTPLMKSLNISTNEEWFVDLIRSSVIDNFGEIVPLDLDAVVMKAQEENTQVNVDECLGTAFKLIDFDEDGFVTQKDIKMLMLRLGETLGDYAVDDMLLAVDGDKDGKINLRDFRRFLLDQGDPARQETHPMPGQVNTAKTRTQTEINIQDADKESPSEFPANSEILVDEDKLKKFRSVVSSIKLCQRAVASGVPFDDKNEAFENNGSNSASFSIETKEQTGLLKDISKSESSPTESIISPRRQEANRLKTLFFGGFINKNNNLTREVSNVTQKEENKCSETEIKSGFMSQGNSAESDVSAEILHYQTDTFPEVSGECEVREGDDSLKKLPVVEDLKDYTLARGWGEDQAHLEPENESLHQAPTHRYVAGVPYLAVNPAPFYQLRRQSVKNGRDYTVSALIAHNGRFFSEQGGISHQILTVPNSSQGNRQHSRPNSCRSKDDSAGNRQHSRPNSCRSNDDSAGNRQHSRPNSCRSNDDSAGNRQHSRPNSCRSNDDSAGNRQHSRPNSCRSNDDSAGNRQHSRPNSCRSKDGSAGNRQHSRPNSCRSKDGSAGNRQHSRPNSCRSKDDSDGNRQHSRPNSCRSKDGSAGNADGFGQTLVIHLRQSRSSSISSHVLPNNNNDNERLDEMGEAAYNSDPSDKGEIDSDEGIELVDEEVIPRALHRSIPRSLEASGTSLRIYLPRGDVPRSKDRLKDDRSRVRKPRSRITIDLRSLSVDDDDDESVKQAVDNGYEKQAVDKNRNIGLNRFTNTFRPKATREFTNFKSVDFHDSFSDDNVDDYNDLRNYKHTHREIADRPSNKTTFSPYQHADGPSNRTTFSPYQHATSPMYDTTEAPNIKSKDRDVKYNHTTNTHLQRKNQQDQLISLNFPKPPEKRHLITAFSVQGVEKTSREPTSFLSYPNERTYVHQDSSPTVQQIFNRQHPIIPKNMSPLLIPDTMADKEQTIAVNYSQPARDGREPYRTTNLEQWNHELRFEKPNRPHPTFINLQNREDINHRRSAFNHNKLLPSRDQANISDSPNKSNNNGRNVNHRILKRSQTSFQFPFFQEASNEPQTRTSSPERSLPQKRSISAATSRNTKSTSSSKHEYKSISVLDLSQTIKIETSYNKNSSLPQRHHTVSNIVPLSRIVNRNYTRMEHHNQGYYSVPRESDKSSVPYFLHDSPRVKALAREMLKKQHEKKTGKKRNKSKSSKSDNLDPFIIPQENEVPTLVGEFKDDDVIPNQVIFSTIRQVKDE